jgi:hypothetical protein
MLGLVKHLVFDFLHEVTQHPQERGLLCGFRHLLRGVFLERRRYGIRIPCLEKDKMLRGIFRSILYHGEVNAIFPGDTLKRFDVFVTDFDVRHSMTLPYKLFDALLAFTSVIFRRSHLAHRFFVTIQKQFHGFGEVIGGQFAALYDKANILVIDLVVIYNTESHPFAKLYTGRLKPG